MAGLDATTGVTNTTGTTNVGGLTQTAPYTPPAEIAQNYQNLFGRAADTSGAQYWAGTGLTGDALKNAMLAGAQGTDLSHYQAAQDYQSLFGRAADEPGLSYWTGTGLTGDALKQAMLAGAQGTDITAAPLMQNINTANQNVFGADYQAPTGFNAYQQDLQNKVLSGQMTTDQYTQALQQSNYNKAQEAGNIANIATNLYGMSNEDAVKLAQSVYSGAPTTATDEISKDYYSLFGRAPDQAGLDYWKSTGLTGDALKNAMLSGSQGSDITANKLINDYTLGLTSGSQAAQINAIKDAANAKDAATNPYFQKNPDLLSVYKNIGDTTSFNNAGTGGQYGYYQGIPILKASEADKVFDQLGTDYIQGNAPDKLDNGMGWDTGSLSAVEARGAAALGIKKDTTQANPFTGESSQTTYSGDMNSVAKQLGLDPTKYTSQDDLYNAINDKAKDFYYMAGKTGTGKTNAQGETSAFTRKDVSGNHAGVLYQKQGDKLIPIPSTLKYYNGQMELSPGSFFKDMAPIAMMAASMFAPELAAAYGGGALGAAGAGATIGAGGAALTGKDVFKGGALGGLGGYLGSQVGDIGKSFTSIGVTDPAIQNILARGSINLGMNIAGGAPLENALLNTGLNLGLNQAGVSNTPATNLATSIAAPLITTGKVNPMTIANAALRTSQQTQTKKQGGLVSMKTGGKVQHFEDGGDVSYDWSSPGGGVDYTPSINLGGLDLSGVNAGFGPDLSGSFIPTYDINSTFIPTDLSGLDTLQVLPSDLSSANSGFSQLDNRSPTLIDIGPGASNTNAFDFTSGQMYNNQATTADQIVQDAANAGYQTQTMDDGSKMFIDKDTGLPVGGVDNTGRAYTVNADGTSTYNDTGESIAGEATTNFGGNLADPKDVQKLLDYNSAIARGGYPVTNPDGSTSVIDPKTGKTMWNSGGGGGGTNTPSIIPKALVPTTKTAAQTAGVAPTESPLNVSPHMTKGHQISLVGLPTYSELLTPMKKDGGLIQGYAEGEEVSLTPRMTKRRPGALNAFASPKVAQVGMPEFTMKAVKEGGQISDHNPEFFSEGGLNTLKHTFVKGRGDGTSDSVPAMLANGEFVIPADVVSGLGNGSNDAGAKVLDEFLRTIRDHKRKADSRHLPPDSKGPGAYLLEAKRKVKKK